MVGHPAQRHPGVDRRSARLTHARRHWPGLADVPEGWSLAPLTLQQSFVNTYGEEHRSSRRRIAPSFSPRQVEEMRPQVQATADRLIEALAALPPGATAEVRQTLALPLTMTVICDLLFEHLLDLTLAHPGEEPARLPSFIVNGPVDLEIVPHPA